LKKKESSFICQLLVKALNFNSIKKLSFARKRGSEWQK